MIQASSYGRLGKDAQTIATKTGTPDGVGVAGGRR